ncbi:hypothetical protein GF312_13165, partial [Candidatus Poribacteria bacterium]|nr:hypothetical protein [Candidatus Poribacteria bacterium]
MKILTSITVMIFICSVASYGQVGLDRKAYNLTVSSKAEFQSWSKTPDEGDSYSISQFSLPLSVKYAVTRNIAVNLLTSAVMSSSDDNSLSGLRDLKARTVMMFADDKAMIGLGLNLPTGKSDLNSDQEAVSLLLSDRAMRFRYSNLGEGFDISLNGGYAQDMGSVVLGGGAGYIKKGEYDLSEGQDSKYKPGDQLTFTAGMDIPAKPLLMRTDVTYTTYQS